MKNTSQEFSNLAMSSGALYAIKITVNNTTIQDKINDFKYYGMCNDNDAFIIGNACTQIVSFSITNPTNTTKTLLSNSNNEITVYQGLLINGSYEYVRLGLFTVLKPEITDETYSYKCVDRMTSRLAKEYVSDLEYPTTDLAIINEICTKTNITFNTPAYFETHTVNKKYSGYTYREMISFMAMLQGQNAIINDLGNLDFRFYTNTVYSIGRNRLYLDGIKKVNTESAFVIDYIKCSVKDYEGETGEDLVVGDTNSTGITISNPFMTEDILDEIYNEIGGFELYNTEFEFLGDFRLELGDIVTVTCKYGTYSVPIMQIDHSSDGGVVTIIRSITETKVENSVDTSNPVIKELERYTNKIDNIAGKTTVLETQVEVVQGQITDKVWQQDIDDSLDDYSTTTETQALITTSIANATPSIVLAVKQDNTIKSTIKEVDVLYAQSTSQYIAPTTGWQTTAPTYVEGMYIWQKTKTVPIEGEAQYSTPTCISGYNGTDGTDGVDGVDGKDGVGISLILEEYYLSTSNATQTGGTWSSTCPTYDGTKDNPKYYWTRSHIYYDDDDERTTTPVLAGDSNSFCQTSKITEAKLELKIDKDDNNQIISMINASANDIIITSNRLYIDSDNFELEYDGTITAKAGNIGNWVIGENMLYTKGLTSSVNNNLNFAGIGTYGENRVAFWAGREKAYNSADDSYAPFAVTHDGRLFATNVNLSGKITAGADSKIGPLEVHVNEVCMNNGSIGVGIGSYAHASGEYAIWAGANSTNIGAAPFHVSYDGRVYASQMQTTYMRVPVGNPNNDVHAVCQLYWETDGDIYRLCGKFIRKDW